MDTKTLLSQIELELQRQVARLEYHVRSLQRIWATSHRKKGAPSMAVTTPIGSVRPSGLEDAARSRRAAPSVDVLTSGWC